MNERDAGLNADFRAAVEAFGADLGRWRDRDLANRVRAAALSDRAFRAWLADATALERRLAAARDAEDAAVRESGAVDRVRAAVAARHGSAPRRRRFIAAAAIVVAAGIGGIVDSQVALRSSDRSLEVVAVDPLVFGPLGSDFE